MKWALIGASDIAATQLIPALRARGQDIRIVMSQDDRRGQRFAEVQSIPASTTSLREALHGVDVAYISTTNDKHRDQAVTALRVGVHVLCEKPLAMTVEQARDMVATAAESDRVLAVNHHQRSNPALRALRDTIAQGRIGELLSVRVDHAVLLPERLRGWRLNDVGAGGGVALDLTVHDIDSIRFVTGLEPTQISATAVTQRFGAGVPDALMTTGVLGDHVLFSTHDAFTVEENTTSFTAHGTAGTLVARDCLTPQPVGTLDLVADGVASPVELAECHSLYEAVVDAFVNAVAGRGRPLAEGTDGQRSLTVALAAQLAASQGRAIAIPPEPAEASSKHVIVQPVEEEVS